MENQRIIRSRGIEVNTMTILDASGFKKDTQDVIDDSAYTSLSLNTHT